MASTYSTNLKIELQATGENSGTWGTITNTNLGTALEQAIVGYGNPDFATDANLTLTYTDTNAAQAARALVLNVTSTGSLSATRELIVPTIQKQYIVQNNTTGGQSITVKTSAGTGITVPNGRKAHLYVDGTNVIYMDDYVDINGGAIDGTPIGANSASTGAFSTLSASGNVTLSGGTANGVLYLNASKVATSGSALTFDGTTVGVNSGVAGGTAMSLTGTYTGSGSVAFINFQRSGGAVAGTLGYDDANTRMQFGTTTNHSLAFLQNNSAAMALTSTGLGIGTASPGSRLEIAAANPFFTIYNTSTGDNGITWESDAASGASRASLFLNYTNAELRMTAGVNGNSYIQTFYTNGTEKLRLDASGNLGLGVTPSAGNAGIKAFQIGALNGLYMMGGSGVAQIGSNYYFSSGYKYGTTGAATNYETEAGAHKWYTAPSGTAGNAITFTQAMTLDASGNLLVGTTTTSSLAGAGRGLIEVNGSSDSAFAMKANNTLYGYLYNSASEFRVANVTSNPVTFFTDNTERARITSGGDLLVGKTGTDPTVGVGIIAGYAGSSLGALFCTKAETTDASSTLGVYSTGATAYRFYVGMAGTVFATNTTISAISDQRFKENIKDLDVGLDAILALKPRKFDWKEGKGKDIKGDRGFIAQEVEQVFPDLIDEWKDPAPEGEEPYKSVRQDLIPVLVKAIQELKAELDATKAKVAALESK